MDTSTWDFAYSSPPSHSATEDDASSLSTPGSPTSSDQSSRHPSWEDICNQYEILSSLHNLGDLDRAGMAYLHSARDILQVEAQLIDQYYHQQIIVLRAFELRRDEAQEVLDAKKSHNAKVAHEDVSANVRCEAGNVDASGKPSKRLSEALIDSAHRLIVYKVGQYPRSVPAKLEGLFVCAIYYIDI
jgi:hypothetical protein